MCKKLKAKAKKQVVRLNPNDYDGMRNENIHREALTRCSDYSGLSDDDDYFQE